jgi:hypothetical protein
MATDSWRKGDLLRCHKSALDPNSLQHIQEHANGTGQKINLGAAMLANLAPVAEMLTVVSYYIVATLSQPRAGANDYIRTARCAVRSTSNSYGAATTKLTYRDLLNQSFWIADAACVMNHTAFPNVNSMVAVAGAANNELSSGSGFHGLDAKLSRVFEALGRSLFHVMLSKPYLRRTGVRRANRDSWGKRNLP